MILNKKIIAKNLDLKKTRNNKFKFFIFDSITFSKFKNIGRNLSTFLSKLQISFQKKLNAIFMRQ